MDQRDNRDQATRTYDKELTVEVEIEGEERITMMQLLRKVKEECGTVLACRFKTPKKYELTMQDDSGKEKLMDGLKIGNNIIVSNELSKNELVVSFMALPAYITDDEILTKLKIWGVNAVSPIKRRVWPGTDIAEGTRFVKVRFPKEVLSLPYSTKFETLQGAEYFRVLHDRQVKVCRLCIRPGHIMMDCPEFVCFKCGKQGHYARQCVSVREESGELLSAPEDIQQEDEAEEEEDGSDNVTAVELETETGVVEETPVPEEGSPAGSQEEETPSREMEEAEGGGGHQRAAQRAGEKRQPSQHCPAARRVLGGADDIGSSMDGVVEEMDLSMEGKIEREGGVGPSVGPAPRPNDHVSTSTGGSPGEETFRRNLGRARGGVKTRGGMPPGPVPGAVEEMRRREMVQEKEWASSKAPEQDTVLSDDEMDLSPEAMNSLKRKAMEERRRVHEKSAKK